MGGRRARGRTGLRRAAALALALAAAATAAPGSIRAARADESGVAVDRQVYIAKTPADPYNNDQLALHVSAAGGQEVARSYAHLALDPLFEDANVSGAVLTLVQDTNAANNANSDKAIIQACVLTQPIPATVNAGNAPSHDCAKGSAVGKAQKVDNITRWTFDLRNLVSYWNSAGNTGLTLIGVIAPGDTWSVAYDKTQTAATSTFSPKPASPPAASGTSEPEPASEPAAAPASSGSLGGLAFETPAPANPSVPAPNLDAGAPGAPAPATPNETAGGVRTVPGRRSSTWIWVLLAALVAAALLAAQPLAAVVTAGAGNVRAALTNQLQQHARAMATSFVVIVWTVTYGAYSILVTPEAHVITGGGFAATAGPNPQVASPNDPNADGSPAPGSPANSPVATGNAGRTGNPSVAAAARQRGNNTVALVDPNTLPPAARLFSQNEDRIGMTDTTVKLCGHAALALGPAFHIGEADLKVFWQNLNDQGGIHGRKFDVTWLDDVYQPGNAVTRAQECKDAGAFMLLGGIGFDQIPAVRVWAEQNKMLYLHHVAVKRGTEGFRYSFTGLPSVEEMGRTFGEMAVQKYSGKKVGILWRNSSNWQPGRDEFRRVVAGKVDIVGDYPVSNNQGTYTQQLVDLKSKGADVVFAWENATAATAMIRQAKAQAFSPHWLLFPFNLTLQTVGADALDPPLDGVAAWPAYTFNNHAGPYASYAADLIEFERQYQKYDPSAELSGPGGDLLFLAWVGFKQLADLFQQCGRDCSRNKMAATMLTYHRQVSPNCDADFTVGDHHHAAPRMDILGVLADRSGAPAWAPAQRCVSTLR